MFHTPLTLEMTSIPVGSFFLITNFFHTFKDNFSDLFGQIWTSFIMPRMRFTVNPHSTIA